MAPFCFILEYSSINEGKQVKMWNKL